MRETQTRGGGTRRASSQRTKPWFKSPFLWAAVLGMLIIPLMRPFTRREPPPPPVFGSWPEATRVVGMDGEVREMTSWGRPVVVQLFYTGCGEFCEEMSRAAQKVSQRWSSMGDDVVVVSVSVDPAADDAQALAAFAKAQALDGGGPWEVLRLEDEGDVGGVLEALTPGTLGLTEGAAQQVIGFLVLVDAEGRVRGFYGSDEQGLDELFHRTRHVIRETR